MSKIELVWNEDPRSIGILEETEDGSDTNFKPLIMFNFVLLGYISCGDHPYRGYQLMVKTHGGNEFRIVVTEREIQRSVYIIWDRFCFHSCFIVFLCS